MWKFVTRALAVTIAGSLLYLLAYGILRALPGDFGSGPALKWAVPLGIVLAIALLALAIGVGTLVSLRGKGKSHPKPKAKDDHAHGGHGHGHAPEPWWKKARSLLLWVGVLALLGYGVFNLHACSVRQIQDNTTYSASRARAAMQMAERSAGTGGVSLRLPGASQFCPSDVSLEWQTFTAPAAGQEWPALVEVPRCHRIVWCKPTDDLTCPKRDVAGYEEQCREISGALKIWTQSTCKLINASRTRSLTAEPIEMLYRFEKLG